MGQLPPLISALASDLRDATCIYHARVAIGPVLRRLLTDPLNPGAVALLRTWLDVTYPQAAEALDRIQVQQERPASVGVGAEPQDSGSGERAGAPVAPAPTMPRPIRTTIRPPLTEAPLTHAAAGERGLSDPPMGAQRWVAPGDERVSE